MDGTTGGATVTGPWQWAAAGRHGAAAVRDALAAALGAPVAGLDAPAPGAALCDVWHVGGDFPTLVDVHLVPAGTAETAAALRLAARLGAAVLRPDDTLNPTRYLLAAPDGGVRAVHVTETETDDGTERRDARPCTGADPACAAAPERHAA